MKRKMIKIDAEKCNGCGHCITACAEGALGLVNGKAVLLKDSYCDGLGACLGHCPQDAITFEERDADAFDPEEVEKHLASKRVVETSEKAPCGCPSSRAFSFSSSKEASTGGMVSGKSALTQWPVQLHLVPTQAPWWAGADLLLAADCAAIASGEFHHRLLNGKKLAIACPKLDNTGNYVEKLAEILRNNEIRSVTVVHLEVPCCTGLVHMAQAALQQSGKSMPFHDIVIGIQGSITELS